MRTEKLGKSHGQRLPRRLLLVVHRGGLAGTERHVLWLATCLKERGWEVSLVLSEAGPIGPIFVSHGIDVTRIGRSRGLGSLYVLRLARLARKRSIDVMHVHSGRLAAAAGRLARLPAILETRHGLGPLGDPPDPRLLRREAKRSRLAHRTFTVCQVDRESLIDGGLPEDRVVAVPNGIPQETSVVPRTRADDETIRLGFVGRLVPQKNPLFLADLCAELQERCRVPWTLAIAGEGPLRSTLFLHLSRRGLEKHVRWLGETIGSGDLLASSDFLLVPSEWEGQPLAVLEAMYSECLVIARRLPCLEELLGGEPPAGVLLPLDVQEWCAAILSLQSDRDARLALLEEARVRVARRHRLGGMVDAIERSYLDCFAQGSRP